MFQTELCKMKLPPVHISNGKEYYLDPLRKRLIPKTPEETVRQRILQYSLTVLSVPKQMIQVEMLLSKYGIDSIQRADIVIERFQEDSCELSPLTVIECKAPDIMLGDSAIEQALDYAEKLGADYVVITNGKELISARYDIKSNRYIDLSGIPTYEEMLNGTGTPLELKPEKQRFSFDELTGNQSYYSGYEFNPNTPQKLLPFLTNLWECFLDTSHRMPTGQYKLFTLKEDYGIRYLSCGNAAGGAYQGAYRSLLIEHKGNTKFMNLAFFDYGSETILTVSVDQDNKKPHNSLQYAIDTNLIKDNETYHFNHSGRIAVGKVGSGKTSELKELLAQEYPSILTNGQITLGTLHNTALLYMDNPEVIIFVENILSYALIRDLYRDKVKSRHKNSK